MKVPIGIPALRLADLPSMGAALFAHYLLRRGPIRARGVVSDEAPVIIAGMHRSGTSLVTRLLERGGLYVGGCRVDENHESIHFTRANRAMCGEGAWLLHDYGWASPKADDFIRARVGYAERAAAGMTTFFRGRHPERGVWGWKDPRNSLTLPVWLAIFPSARVLHVVRDGRSVALSLADRDELDPAFGLALWGHYVARIERALAAVPRTRKLTVRYEDLVRTPTAVLRRMYEFCGLNPRERLASLSADVDSGLADARLGDIRAHLAGDHPLLARYGYSPGADTARAAAR